MLVADFLLPKNMRASIRLLSGYFLGFTVLALLYLVESLTGLGGIIMVAGPVLSVLAVVRWIRCGRPSLFNDDQRIRPTHIIIFAIIYVVSFLCFQFWYAKATQGITTVVYHDFLFHTGNIISLSRSFPNYDIRVDGIMFYYHYFMELIYAMCKHIFKMDAFSVYMNGNAFVCAWPLMLAFAALGDRIRAGRQVSELRYFFYNFGTMFSLVALYPCIVVGARLPLSWTDNHLFGNGNALGLCVSLTILYMEIIVEVWDKKYQWKNLLLTLLIMVAVTGFKGNAGIALATITVAVFVIEWIITHRFSGAKLVYTIASVISFAVTYMVVDEGIAVSGANNRTTELSPKGTLDFSRVGEVIERFLHQDYMKMPWIAIAIPLCAIVIIGPLFIPMVEWFVKKFRELFKTWEIGDVYDWFAIGSIIIAEIAYCSINIEGLSQGYMIIGVAPFVFYGVMKYFEDGASSFMKKYCKFFWGLGVLFMLVDISYYVVGGLNWNARYSVEAGDDDQLVSAETMEAYFWIRDNTPEDAMLAVDRHTESLDWRQIYFYCSSFSERQCYIEGFDYTDVAEEQSDEMMAINETFFDENASVAEPAMEQCGIDYLVVTKHSNPDYVCTSDRLDLVFQNEEVAVYEFN